VRGIRDPGLVHPPEGARVAGEDRRRSRDGRGESVSGRGDGPMRSRRERSREQRRGSERPSSSSALRSEILSEGQAALGVPSGPDVVSSHEGKEAACAFVCRLGPDLASGGARLCGGAPSDVVTQASSPQGEKNRRRRDSPAPPDTKIRLADGRVLTKASWRPRQEGKRSRAPRERGAVDGCASAREAERRAHGSDEGGARRGRGEAEGRVSAPPKGDAPKSNPIS